MKAEKQSKRRGNGHLVGFRIRRLRKDRNLTQSALASQVADALLEKGIYVIGFSFPVVPEGKARIRTQISAAHTREDLEFAIEQFAAVKIELGI